MFLIRAAEQDLHILQVRQLDWGEGAPVVVGEEQQQIPNHLMHPQDHPIGVGAEPQMVTVDLVQLYFDILLQ